MKEWIERIKAALSLTSEPLNTFVPTIAVSGEAGIHSLEKFSEKPVRKRAKLTFETVEAFCQYLLEHKTTDTRMFTKAFDPYSDCNATTAAQLVVNAVIDFHGPTDATWGDHEATLKLGLDDRFIDWLDHTGSMNQVDFANFIEERVGDIVDPDGADILELARFLQITQRSQIMSMMPDEKGDTLMHYETDTQFKLKGAAQSGDYVIPKNITIKVPVFHDGAEVEIPLKFQAKQVDTRAVFTLKIVGLKAMLRKAQDECLVDITAKTGIQPFVGSLDAYQ